MPGYVRTPHEVAIQLRKPRKQKSVDVIVVSQMHTSG